MRLLVITTSKAGGLISPKRALLLASLKGITNVFFVLKQEMLQINLVFMVYAVMIYANYTGAPKRNYLNRFRIELLLTHSHLNPECIFEPSPRPSLQYLHNIFLPKNDDCGTSSSTDYAVFFGFSHRIYAFPDGM